jgi:hypothetical protein
MERTTMESEPPVIRFFQEHGYTGVQPGLPAWLLRELVVPERQFTLCGARGFESVVEDVRLYDERPYGRTRVLTGIVPRLSERLLQAGYHVKVTRQNYVNDQPPRWDAFKRADPGAVAALQVLEDEPRGQILASSRGAMLEAIILLCRFFSGKVMVVADSRREMYRITHLMRKRLKEPVLYMTKENSLSESRIEVGPVGSLDLMLADVVLLANANQALLKKTSEYLSFLSRQRIYGLRLISEQESLRRKLLLEGIIGPVLLHAGPPWKLPREVLVLLADWRCRSSAYSPFGLEWKRHAIWQNSDRNEAIAEIAQALVAGDLVALGEHGIFPHADGEAILEEHPRRVAILVESLEHAKAMVARLPGWRVVTGQSDSSSIRPEVTVDPSDHTEPMSHLCQDQTIITLVGASKFPMSSLDILIRADGLTWPLGVLGLLDRARGGKQRQLLLIDLRDDFDEVAAEATRCRIADYRRRSWEVLGGQQIREREVPD